MSDYIISACISAFCAFIIGAIVGVFADSTELMFFSGLISFILVFILFAYLMHDIPVSYTHLTLPTTERV